MSGEDIIFNESDCEESVESADAIDNLSVIPDKSHTELNLVNRRDMEARTCENCRGSLLPIRIDVFVRCHAQSTSRHSARPETVYVE
ncbi:hypothetical protein TNCV_4399981 [Trichonephila clavipes]|nr:hypothetical protein TNCV_4399981 [Trichonephila clavipes]